jgi:hypothetical protein
VFDRLNHQTRLWKLKDYFVFVSLKGNESFLFVRIDNDKININVSTHRGLNATFRVNIIPDDGSIGSLRNVGL